MNPGVRLFFGLFMLSLSCVEDVQAQVKAKAISYSIDVYHEAFDPVYYAYTESEDPVSRFEADVYFTNGKVKSVVREVSQPIDYSVALLPVMYIVGDTAQYRIDDDQRTIHIVKTELKKPQRTRNQKKILGHKCRQYYFVDSKGVYLSLWVAEKLEPSICPIGNFLMKGVVLELLTSNGVHCIATDMASGEVPNDFFNLPQGYMQKSASQIEHGFYF